MFDDFGQGLLRGSHEIVEALRNIVRDQNGRAGDINPHRAAAVSIARAMRLSGSIDEFVERHKDDVKVAECAKLAIAKSILESERNSKLFFDHRYERDELIDQASDSWLAYLLRDLTRGMTTADLEKAFDNLYVVNFNYDRCVEHFIFLWIQQVYGLNETRSGEITKKLRIYHPYGKLAALPFENPGQHLAFGGKVDAARLLSIMPRIKTYSEAVKVGSDLLEARAACGQATKMVFLGFAFHEQNMKLLQLDDEHERASLRCYGTTYGISAPRLELDKIKIAQAMKVINPQGLFFEGVDGTCERFWREYGDVVVS